MSAISKLFSKSTRTLVNTDIMPVQDSAGASWYKTTLAALKEFLYTEILGTSNTWTSPQTFEDDISLNGNTITDLANGVNSSDAVTVSQLGTKQDSINSNSSEVIVNFNGDIKGSTILKTDEGNGFLNITPIRIPTSTGDSLGSTGDITFDRNFIYIKTTDGWKRATLSTF